MDGRKRIWRGRERDAEGKDGEGDGERWGEEGGEQDGEEEEGGVGGR